MGKRFDSILAKRGYLRKPQIIGDPATEWFINKATRSYPTDIYAVESRHIKGVLKPKYNPIVLVSAVETVSVLSTVISKICNEVVKNGWDWEPKFVRKCLQCGLEHDEDIEECDCKSKLLKKPDRSQLVNIDKLFSHPNSDENGYVKKTFMDIIKDCVYYNKSIDDFYIEVVPGVGGQPVEIWSLPAEDIRIFGDETVKGFKDDACQKFCTICYYKEKYYLTDKIYTDREFCPDCGRKLDITSFVQMAAGGENIVARWSSEQILHSNSRGFGNRLYGNPPVISVLNQAMILNWMEIYQRDAYSLNKAPDGIMAFPGWDTDELLDMQDKIMQRKRANPADKAMVWLPTQDAPIFINTMPKLVDMDGVEVAKYLRENIAIRYGVSLNMLGVQTPGKLGNETETVEVSYGTIEETQTQLAEVINCMLLPRFNVTDWRWTLLPPKKDDELRKAQLVQTYASTVAQLRSSGIDAIMTEGFEIGIRGEQPPPKEPEANPFGSMFMKGRRYIKNPEDAPPGVDVKRGEEGGYYYDIEETERDDDDEDSDDAPTGDKPKPTPSESDGTGDEITIRLPANSYDETNKALTPRDISPSDAVARIRELENTFVKNISDKYTEGVKEVIKMAEIKGMTEVQLQGEIESFTESFMEKALQEARLFSQDAYELGMKEELKSLGVERRERFTQIDENALSYLSEQPHSVFNSIKTFGDDNVSQFREIIENAYATPGEFDLTRMVKQMKEAAGGSVSKLERIARSETTKISNMGRSEQWKQYADPDKKEYYWIIARDNNVSALCRAIANGGSAKLWGKPKVFPGNPYTLSELEHYTAGGLPHPNCRSTMVRKPLGGDEERVEVGELA